MTKNTFETEIIVDSEENVLVGNSDPLYWDGALDEIYGREVAVAMREALLAKERAGEEESIKVALTVEVQFLDGEGSVK